MPAGLIRRALLQLPPALPQESTLTLTSEADDGSYISIRPFHDSAAEFPFEWVLAGTEVSYGEQPGHVIFPPKRIDTNEILNSPLYHAGELNTYWAPWPATNFIQETGELVIRDGTRVPFFELWQPVQPEQSTPEQFIDAKFKGVYCTKSAVYVPKDGFVGIIIVTDNWLQGIVHKEGASSPKDIAVVRSWFNGEKWENQVAFGEQEWFPDFDHEFASRQVEWRLK